MASSPIDNNDLITSFSNPNYQLNDELNANVTSDSTQYYDQGNIYDEEDDFNGTQTDSTKQRRKYAHIDLTSMGIELNNGEEKISADNASLSSPDSLITSPSSDGRSEDSILYSDIKTPTSTTGNVIEVEHNDSEDDSDTQSNVENQPKGFLGYYASLELSAKARQKSREEEEEEEDEEENSEEKKKVANRTDDKANQDDKQSYEGKTKDINSPDSNDSGIQADEGGGVGVGGGVQHIQGPVTGDLYAVVHKNQKNVPQSSPSDEGNISSSPQGEEEEEEEKEDGDTENQLPPGWEKHEDDQGPYYWHIKTGTIQRDAPPPAPADIKETKRSLSTNSDISLSSSGISSPSVPSTPSSYASSSVDQDHHLQEFEGHAFKYATESLKSLRKPTAEVELVPEASEKPIRFAVRSLGWVRIAEEDLTPERSSKAVNKCIVDLSLGRNDINDVVGRWGDGKDLNMDLDSQHLSLIDPQEVSVLNRQPIQSIRVWGVGRDNGRERDFAYVARDRVTRKHMCHVFRCDTPARQIANTLRDICKKIMMERAQQSLATPSEPQAATKVHRPTNLPDLQKVGEANGQKLTFQNLYKTTSFPTPMEEPKKVLRGHYLGTAMVPKPTGMDLLNTAMEKVYARVPPEKWTFVNVAVAPSTITITEHATEKMVAECRVRFLSFMGIAQRNVKLCSFIMHGASEQYIAHVFHCEPSAGALCKTIEAACKLRYQKCLDAHPTTPDPKKQQIGANTKGIKASIKQGVACVLENMKSKKVKS